MHDESAGPVSGISDLALNDAARVSLCEVLDRVLNKGIVVVGEATISVADIDLVYLGLQLVLTSIENCRQGFRNPLAEFGAGAGVRNGES
jgi:gas vesicle protein GvpA/GvpJ/GvpM family